MVGKRIRQMRRKAGLTVSECARRAGMWRTHWTAIESGRIARVRSRTWAKMARVLGDKEPQQ